jgi:hypothetical protein
MMRTSYRKVKGAGEHQSLKPIVLSTQGRNQEDHGLKLARANSAQYPISKNLSQKRADGVVQALETCLGSGRP